jgi:hypothetical protein
LIARKPRFAKRRQDVLDATYPATSFSSPIFENSPEQVLPSDDVFENCKTGRQQRYSLPDLFPLPIEEQDAQPLLAGD